MRERVVAYRALSALTHALPLARRRGRRAPVHSDGPVRIFLLDAYRLDGTTRTALHLAAHLSRRHEVELISLVRLDERPFFPFPAGVRVTTLDDRRPGVSRHPLARLLSRLPSLFMHPDDAAYHWYSLWTDFLTLRRLRELRTGALITTRAVFSTLAARLARPEVLIVGQEHRALASYSSDQRAELARRYRQLDVLAVLTQGEEREYARLLRGAATRIVRIPNALSPTEHAPAGGRENVVLAAGRLDVAKGYDLLIPAFAAVAERRPDWRLVIYGDGPERARLEQLIRQSGLESEILLPGPTTRLEEAMSKASIFVLSSRHEAFPMVILEAMSKGMAVVSFDCPTGPREAITPGHDGVLVPPEDIGALSRALLELIDDDQRRRRLGIAAQRAAAGYGLAAVGRQWEQVLEGATTPEAREPLFG